MYLPGPSSKHLVSGQRGQLKVAGKESAKRAGHNPNPPREGKGREDIGRYECDPGDSRLGAPNERGRGVKKGS